MNSLDAAYQVLVEADEPLHSREITRRILERDLWQTTGKTPEATIDARIAVDIKRRGAASRFRRVGKSTFTINGQAPLVDRDNGASVGSEPGSELSAGNQPITTASLVAAKTLSFTDAAEQVLERLAKRKPMHYRTITDKALELGLITTAGRTPDQTMYAMILTEIERMTRRGEQPRFSKQGKGYVGLTRWEGKGLAYEIEQHNREVRRQLHAHIRKLQPADFEALVGRLLTALGFESVVVTPLVGDGGIDVRGILVVGDVIRTRMAVQVKRWRQNVQAPVVQQVRGSLGAHEQGLIITTSDFSEGARKEASRPDATPVALMNGEQFVNLLIEHDIGVRRATHDLIELGEDDEEV